MMTDKIIMGLVFILVVLIVVAIVFYTLFGKKNETTGEKAKGFMSSSSTDGASNRPIVRQDRVEEGRTVHPDVS